ncbi:hypothetical protein B0H13DRAFT_1876808 [Mycena leptocephala]|nr:hypothetical protein B0H13DRAFT_1876808 [Mycena leptocephala]
MPQGFETRGLVPNMDVALVSALHTMPAATLCNLPLSTAFDYNLKKSLSSLEWVLSSGVPTVISVSGPLSLPYRDGAVDTTHEACIYLASGVLTFARYHEHLRRHTGGTFRMLMSRLIVANSLFCFSPLAIDATPLCPAAV